MRITDWSSDMSSSDLDHAFNHTFGREETKELLIDLLNCLMEGRKTIRDVRFSSVERQGGHPGSRTVRFDIQCTADNGEQFLLEMQFEPLDNLSGRVRFYSKIGRASCRESVCQYG